MVSKEEYESLLLDRPKKFNAEQVGYSPSEDDASKCENCQHFYVRRIDSFGVCEIFRDDRTDEEGIQPNWKCRFVTRDGINFPLLTQERSSSRREN